LRYRFLEMADGLVGTSGIDAEIKRKLDLKYNSEKEQNAREWLQALLGETFPESTLQEALQNGMRLCRAANKIAPGSAKINTAKFQAAQRENISSYLKACKVFSFNPAEIFETADLYDGKNMVLVIENIYKLAERAQAKGLPAIRGAPKLNYSSAVVDTAGGYVSGSSGSTSSYTPPVSSDTTPSYSSYTEPEPVATTVTSSESAPTSSSSGGEETVCPDCGAARESGAQFCGDCGHQYF